MRPFRAGFVLLLLAAGPAAATQEYLLPSLFDVQGVTGNDVLNIRQEPNASAPILGSLAPDATHVEVVEETQGWGRINFGEASGWVAMRFLAPRTETWAVGELPPSFACFGTEPFWSVRQGKDGLQLDGPDLKAPPRPVRSVLDNGIFRDPMRAVVAGNMTVVATPQLCSDGMSDRLFGLRASVILQGDNPRLLTGCCSVQP
jgi:uncharacterized membrane protein